MIAHCRVIIGGFRLSGRAPDVDTAQFCARKHRE
jgi:hypothetical protein